jgi:hypothetical protein
MRDRDELEDAGPALRVGEERWIGAEAPFTYRPVVEGIPEEPSALERERRRSDELSLRRYVGVALAGLLAVAGAVFVADGLQRGEELVATVGLVGFVVSALAALAAIALTRTG